MKTIFFITCFFCSVMILSSETSLKFQKLINMDSKSSELHYWKTVLNNNKNICCLDLSASQIDYFSLSGELLYSINKRTILTSEYFQQNKKYYNFEFDSIDENEGKDHLFFHAYYLERMDSINIRREEYFICEISEKHIKNIQILKQNGEYHLNVALALIFDGQILGDMRSREHSDYSSLIIVGKKGYQVLEDVHLDFTKVGILYHTIKDEAYYYENNILYRVYKSGDGYKVEIDSSTVFSELDILNSHNKFHGMGSLNNKPILIYSKKESEESVPALWLEILNKEHENLKLEYPKELSNYKSVKIIGELDNQLLLLMKSNNKYYILKYQIK